MHYSILIYRIAAKNGNQNLYKSARTIKEAQTILQRERNSISNFQVVDQNTNISYNFDKTTGLLIEKILENYDIEL